MMLPNPVSQADRTTMSVSNCSPIELRGIEYMVFLGGTVRVEKQTRPVGIAVIDEAVGGDVQKAMWVFRQAFFDLPF
jgi:hypothetical protein